MRATGIAAGVCLGVTVAVAVPPALAAPETGSRPQLAPSPSKSPRPSGRPTTRPTDRPTADPGDRRPKEPRAQVECNTPQGFRASQITQEPWPQRRLDFEQAWKLTKGRGVTVAVVDSGITAGHPQFEGRVRDFYDTTDTVTRDCFGHGTEVAGIIAAADHRERNVPFVGVAPEATLISAKFTTGASTSDNTHLPKAIRWAAQQGAQVINVSAAAPDTPALRAAVMFAQSKDALIVAAAGNVPDRTRNIDVPAYPASYKGVLSVGSADETGAISDFSNIKSRVDVAAPGNNVVSTLGRGYTAGLEGTSFGAPYAAGVAALVRAYRPNLNYRQVINRIVTTAEGASGTGSGSGMISPLQAVTALTDSEDMRQQEHRPEPIPIAGVPPADRRTRNLGLGIAGGAVGLIVTLGFAGAVIPLGRRRGWRPARAARPADPGPGGA
ncbi:S8 family serine peptidase [Thermomonospora umbrina]|uniref:Type VII secretion-associated serine protease mycosin n=1 Tax=Thermomonospora umbrina TaxID=111806 RepID=A0A3D9SKX2_9ACTN|nr:S8 family serine peptidase [Thermomonospora umbrina]REE96586.1 type VII secretion-associated serine protease mycosin [Thermomonospora umbrina]